MLSQFFILTGRGDPIVSKDYRGDVVRGTAEIFFRKLKSWPGGDPPPIFNVEGIHFVHIKRNGLLFVATSKFNIQPSQVVELLIRISNIFKDYCGILTEESIRVNFVLIYELLDEIIDFGYAQSTSTERLKSYVYNEPIAVQPVEETSAFGLDLQRRSVPSSASNKPISLRFQDQKDRKNEIFLDMLERLTCLFAPNGSLLRSEIDGSIIMKSFLQGTPDLSLGLNEDLVIGKGRSMYSLTLDDCNFHECVNLDNFERGRTLVLRPPDGEFTAMNYRITGQFQNALPFRCTVSFEDVHNCPGRTDIIITLHADIPHKCHGTNIVVTAAMPRATSSCGYELHGPNQSVVYKKEEKQMQWKVNKLDGGTTTYVRLKVMTSEEEARTVKTDMGNLSLEFEIPMYVCSGLNIRFLQVTERGRNYVPFRWVRYITHSDSYVFRTR